VGGRVRTIREPFFGDYVEAGAMRIPASHRLVNAYVNKFKLQRRPFPGSSETKKGYYYIFGRVWNIGEYEEDPLPLHEWLRDEHQYILNDELLDASNPMTISDLWESTFQSLLAEVKYQKDEQAAWRNLCEKYDVSLGDFLKSKGWKTGTMELFGLVGSGIGGYQSTFQSSAIENIREEISLREDLDKPDVSFFEIEGGNDNLPAALANSLLSADPECLNLGATVTRITKNPAKCSATYTVTWTPVNTVLDVKEEADYIVIAIPFTALRSIKVEPSWNTFKAQAIRELHYQHASKIMLQFRSCWWKDPPFKFTAGGALCTDLMVRNIYFTHHNTKHQRGVMLASYTWEDDALWWASKSTEMQSTQALEQLQEFVKSLAPDADIFSKCEGSVCKSWTTDPITSGAYAFFSPGQAAALYDAIVLPVGSIHFAGEHASFNHAWIEGAIQSGLRAAYEIHKL
jgi:monoamine oxidase